MFSIEGIALILNEIGSFSQEFLCYCQGETAFKS